LLNIGKRLKREIQGREKIDGIKTFLKPLIKNAMNSPTYKSGKFVADLKNVLFVRLATFLREKKCCRNKRVGTARIIIAGISRSYVWSKSVSKLQGVLILKVLIIDIV
jgi:hypothetical protein